MLNEIKASEMRRHHNVQVRNHPGATSEDMLYHIKAHARKKPDAVIVTVGHNDISDNRNNTQRQKIDSCDNLQRIIRELKNQVPGIHVSICELTMRRDHPGIMKDVDLLNQKFRQLAQREQIGFVQTNTFSIDHLGKRGLHPNGWGKQKLRDILKNYISNL